MSETYRASLWRTSSAFVHGAVRVSATTARGFEKKMSVTAKTANAVVKLSERDTAQRVLEARHEELVSKLRIRAPTGRGQTSFTVVDKMKKKDKSKDSDAFSEDGSTSGHSIDHNDRWRRARRLRLLEDVAGEDEDSFHTRGPKAFGPETPPDSDRGSAAPYTYGSDLSYSASRQSSKPASDAGSDDSRFTFSSIKLRREVKRAHRKLRSCYAQYLSLMCGEAPMRRVANGLIAAASLFSVISVPFYLALTYRSTELVRIFDHLAAIAFACDVVLGITTTTSRDHTEVLRHYSREVRKYARGWMLIDVIAALPFDLIGAALTRTPAAEHPLRLLRCVKAVKLPKLLRSVQGSLLWRISNEQRALFGILRLLSTVLLAAHYATCLCARRRDLRHTSCGHHKMRHE